MKLKDYKKDEALILTVGEYSDYGVVGIYRIVNDVSIPVIFEKWLDANDYPPDAALNMTIKIKIDFLLYLKQESIVVKVITTDIELGEVYCPSVSNKTRKLIINEQRNNNGT